MSGKHFLIKNDKIWNRDCFKFRIKMSASDCYQLGVQLYKTGDYELASQWLSQALTQLNGTDPKMGILFMEKLTLTYYNLGTWVD